MQYDFSHWPKMPKVICACITYGRAHLIGEAVKSYIDQDYPGESELVILNDQPGITYHGGFILKQNQKITIINHPTRYATIGEKRNVCVRSAEADIFLAWDDDDIHLPWRISLTVSRMTNHTYWKANKLWVWSNGKIKNPAQIQMAPSMAGYSIDAFEAVGGYEHIQSGQDQTLDNRINKLKSRMVGELTDSEVYYIYRFGGTHSYHLSAHGYGKGYDEVARNVKNQLSGHHDIVPHYKQDYLALIKQNIGV